MRQADKIWTICEDCKNKDKLLDLRMLKKRELLKKKRL